MRLSCFESGSRSTLFCLACPYPVIGDSYSLRISDPFAAQVVSPTGDVMRPRWALGKGGTRALHYDHASVPLDLRNSDPRRWVRDEEGRLFEAWKAERDALTAVRGVTTARRRSVSAGLPRNLSGESVEEN